MDQYKVHKKVWEIGVKIVHPFLAHKFKYTRETFESEKPCVVIANHVTNWDALLMAISFPKHHMYFVASEHLFRKGWVSKLIDFLAGPIARKKGSSGVDTAMTCLRHVRRGHSVCIFGEGEVTWDGKSNPVFPGTGMLAKTSGATLVTYRLEGGCLTRPRWATTIRRGKMYGHVVGTYSPEELKTMSTDEVTHIINRDLYEDAFARQKEHPIAYKGTQLATRIESAAFLCPRCKQIGTVKGKGKRIACPCGFETTYTVFGTFDPPIPFANFGEWDTWQHECLKNGDFIKASPLFSDNAVKLVEILDGHNYNEICTAPLTLDGVTMHCGNVEFNLNDISSMAIVQTNILLFTHLDKYYEMRCKETINFRKYLALWKNLKEAP